MTISVGMRRTGIVWRTAIIALSTACGTGTVVVPSDDDDHMDVAEPNVNPGANPAVSCANFTLLEQRSGPPANVLVLFELRRCDGRPLNRLDIDDFAFEENGRAVSQFESDAVLFNRKEAFAIEIVLLLDVSGSVIADPDGLTALREAVGEFLTAIDGLSSVQVFVFDGGPALRPLTDRAAPPIVLDQASGLDEDVTLDSSTNLNGAIIAGLEQLDARQAMHRTPRSTFSGSLVVFTDGTDRANRYADADALGAVRSSDHSVYTIGLGEEIDLTFLDDVGRTDFVQANDIEQLVQAFRQVAVDVRQESERFYALGYCSALRDGNGHLEVTLGLGASVPRPLKATFPAVNFAPGCTVTTLQSALSTL